MTELEGGAYSPWMEDLRKRFARSWPARPLVSGPLEGDGTVTLRAAAVLIPLYVREKALWTLFT
jgi:hypothetical protein